MKKSVLTIAIFMASFLFPYGNIWAQEGLQLGVEGTPHFSWLYNQDDWDSNEYNTFGTLNGNVGVSSHYGFTENVGLGLNVLYSFQGQRYEWRNLELYKKLQYLKIPLTLDLSFPMGMYSSFYVKIGPQLDILMNARIDESDGDEFVDDQMSAYMDAELSGVLSFGTAFELTDRVSFDIGVRGDAGLTNAEDEDYKLNIHNPRDMVFPSPANGSRAMTSNMTLGLTFGLRYNLM